MQTYLALGDSYTFGEGVPLHQGYPYQAIQFLRADGREFAAPEIIARTGWTSGELEHTLSTLRLLPCYDFVSLLIGVNDQYRGYPADEYAPRFHRLLQKGIQLTGNSSKVFALSIPDWGHSPFAAGRDRSLISASIDDFNDQAQHLCQQQNIRFIDITTRSRSDGASAAAFTADGLHPDAATYREWARLLADAISSTLPALLQVD